MIVILQIKIYRLFIVYYFIFFFFSNGIDLNYLLYYASKEKLSFLFKEKDASFYLYICIQDQYCISICEINMLSLHYH